MCVSFTYYQCIDLEMDQELRECWVIIIMNELDIESQRFDCQRYVSHFLKQHSVQDLIKRHNELQHEIKDYD